MFLNFIDGCYDSSYSLNEEQVVSIGIPLTRIQSTVSISAY